MVTVCRPDRVVLTFLDYMNPLLAGEAGKEAVSPDTGHAGIREIYKDISWEGCDVSHVSTGPGVITEC
jgi:hypothetical protein